MKYSVIAYTDSCDISPLESALAQRLGEKGSTVDIKQIDIGDMQDEKPIELKESTRCAHAIIVSCKLLSSQKIKRLFYELCGTNKLYTAISRHKAQNGYFDFCIVQDISGGIYQGDSGFRKNEKFGREAYDTEGYSELEIERNARVAYELAERTNRALTLSDMGGSLATTGLWRKIVADVNEDYPFVSVKTQAATETIRNIATAPHELDTIVTSRLLGDMLNSTACSVHSSLAYTYAVGDTPLAVYLYSRASENNLDELANCITLHSLGGN